MRGRLNEAQKALSVVPRIQTLNPSVKVTGLSHSFLKTHTKESVGDLSFLDDFNIVCVNKGSLDDMVVLF